MMSDVSLDWPLSKEEQKKRIMRLYDKDVQAANELLHSGEAALKVALKALHQKLKETGPAEGNEGSRASQDASCPEHPAGHEVLASSSQSIEVTEEPTSPAHTEQTETEVTEEAREDGENAAEAAERLQHAIVDAAAALASLFGTPSLSSVLVGIAADADKDSPEDCFEVRLYGQDASEAVQGQLLYPMPCQVRHRAKSEGALPVD
ncbi:unnamed protein product [Symbiodinium natans]|uniref:Uncharacterized protein n=1 Tax=Symbiodinium natans TaxID=878477 RepID=A0A812T9K9_9DINO|nr:unnamed protein product [Symbiodinium natans]